MAVKNPYVLRPRVYNNAVLPGNIYARPALAPLVLGPGGTTGAAQRNLTRSYEDQLRRWATSPFAVNSKTYMDELRKRYGYNDAQLSDTFGTIGGVVGAGVGAYVSAKAGYSMRRTVGQVGRSSSRLAGLAPVVGTAFDIAALGFSTAGFVQDVQRGDVIGSILSGIEVAGDATAVVGDVVTLISGWTGAGLVVGEAISAVGAAVAAGVNGIRVGWMLGEAAGRSLTPSGLRAQQLFASNLGQSIINRPLSTITAVTVQFGVPLLLNSLSGAFASSTTRGGRILNMPFKAISTLGPISQFISRPALWMSTNPLGQQGRAALSMFANQAIAPQVRQLDTMLIPNAPEASDFVSAISLFGDIQDNVYGATRNKAILQGLITGNPEEMANAIGRAWGYSDEPAYAIGASDLVESAMPDAPNFVKSVLGVVGEIVLDPRNYKEVMQGIVRGEETRLLSEAGVEELNLLDARVGLNVREASVFRKLVGPDGMFGNAFKREAMFKRAVDAYLTGGVKGLRKYMIEAASQTRRGVSVSTIDVEAQIKLTTDFLDNLIQGNTIQFASKQTRRLLLERKRILDEYTATGRLQSGYTVDDMKRITAYFNFLSQRYDTTDVNQLATKLITDFNAGVDASHVRALFDVSRDFMKYMDVTDGINGTLVKVLNPISAIVQRLGSKGVQWLSDETRAGRVNPAERMRVLKDAKTFLANWQETSKTLPTVQDAQAILASKQTAEEHVANLLNNLYTSSNESDKILVAEIENIIKTDPSLAAFIEQTKSTTMQETVDAINDRIKEINENAEQFRMKSLYVTTDGGKRIVITAKNKATLEKELLDLEAAPKVTWSKDEREYYEALRQGLLSYEEYVTGNATLLEVEKVYQTALTLLNASTTKLNDEMIKLITQLYAFKVYINEYIPQHALPVAERKLQAAKEKLKNNEKLIESTRESIAKIDSDIRKVEADWNISDPQLLKEMRRMQLRDSESAYSKLQADLISTKSKLNNKTTNTGYANKDYIKTLTDEIELREQNVAKIKAAQAKGTVINPKDLAGFDITRLGKSLEMLNALDQVAFLNGYPLQIKQADGSIVELNAHKSPQRVNTPGGILLITPEHFIEAVMANKGQLEIGINLDISFTEGVNAIFNNILNKHTYDVIKDFKLEALFKDPNDWKKLSKREKVNRILYQIDNSDLTETDKTKLRKSKTLRTIFMQIDDLSNRVYSSKFVPLNHINPQVLYSNVLQKALHNKNTTVYKLFEQAATMLKRIDDSLAKQGTFGEIGDAYVEALRDNLDKNLRYSPIYDYVKSYLTSDVTRASNKLALFARASVSDVLPDEIDRFDIRKAKYSKDVIDSIILDVIESDVTEWILDTEDLKRLDAIQKRKEDKRLGNLVVGDIDELASAVEQKDSAHEEHKKESANAKAVIKDTVESSDGDLSSEVLEMLNDDALRSLQFKGQIETDALKTDVVGNKTKQDVVLFHFFNLLNNPQAFIMNDHFTYTLNSTRIIDADDPKNPVMQSFYSYLKSTGRSTQAYEDEVMRMAHRLAILMVKYIGADGRKGAGYLSINGLTIDGKRVTYDDITPENLPKIQASIQALYLKNGGLDIQVKYPAEYNKDGALVRTKQVQASKEYSNLLRSKLKKEVRYYASKHNTDSTTLLKSLEEDARSDNETKRDTAIAIINDLVRNANAEVSRIATTRKHMLFAKTLDDIISQMRDKEIAIKKGIEDYNITLDSGARVRALRTSKEVRNLFDALANIDKDLATHPLMFQLLHKLQEYITEDYTDKRIVNSFSKFRRIEEDGDDVIFVYETSTGKENKYSVFDLILTHRLNIDDFYKLVNTVGYVMAERVDAKVIARLQQAARTQYVNMVEEYGEILTHNTLSISKEAFLSNIGKPGTPEYKQGERDYDLLTDTTNVRIHNGLTLNNRIVDGFDKRKIYGTRVMDAMHTALNATGDHMFINGLGNKDTVKVPIINPKTKLPYDVNTRLLLGLIHTSTDEFFTDDVKRDLIKSIFFYDIKEAKGQLSNSNIDVYTERVAELKDKLQDYTANGVDDRGYNRTIKRMESRIANYEAIIKAYTDISNGTQLLPGFDLNPYTDFDKFYSERIVGTSIHDTSKDADVAKIFNSTYDSDSDKYMVVRDVNTKELVLVSAQDAKVKSRINPLKQGVLGIPELNHYMVNHIYKPSKVTYVNETKERLNKDLVWTTQSANLKLEVVKATADGDIIIKVSDDQYANVMKQQDRLKGQIKKAAYVKDDAYNVYDVYFISESKHKQFTKGIKNKEEFPMVMLYEIDTSDIEPLPDVLNVKSNKVLVDAYINDLRHIQNVVGYTSDSSGKRVPKSTKDAVARYGLYSVALNRKKPGTEERVNLPLYKAYNQGVSLFNTNILKSLQKNARVTSLFFEFSDMFSSDEYDLYYIGREFFKAQFMRKGFNLKNLEQYIDIKTSTQLKRITLKGSSKNLFENVRDALEHMQKKYGNEITDDIKYENVLREDDVNNLLKLKRIVYSVYDRYARTNRTVRNKVRPLLEKHLNEAIPDELLNQHIAQQQSNFERDLSIIGSASKIFTNIYNGTPAEVLEQMQKQLNASHGTYTQYSNQQVADYYSIIEHDYYKDIEANHKANLRKHRTNFINFKNYNNLKNLLIDYVNATGDDKEARYAALQDSIKVPTELLDMFAPIAEDIVNKTGKGTVKDIQTKLAYDYVLRAYIASVTQYVNRGTGPYGYFDGLTYMVNTQGNDFARSIDQARYNALVGKITAGEELTADEIEFFKETHYKLEAYDLATKPVDKSVRYKINAEHYNFTGLDADTIHSHVYPDYGDFKVAKGVTIEEYLLQYLKDEYNYDLPGEFLQTASNAVSKLLTGYTDILYNHKQTITAPRKVEVPPVYVDYIKEVKEFLKSRGMSQVEIEVYTESVIRALSNKTPIYLEESFVYNERKQLVLKQEVATALSDATKIVIEGRKTNRDVRMFVDKKALDDVESIIDYKRINLLDNSRAFYKHLVNGLRGTGKTFDEVATRLNKLFGINATLVNEILSNEIKSTGHLTNIIRRSITDANKARLFIYYVNYMKQKYIEAQGYASIDDVKRADMVTIREATSRLRVIDQSGVLEQGNSTNEPIGYMLNKGFDIIQNVQANTSYYRNRLDMVKVAPGHRNTDFDGSRRKLIYTRNNVVQTSRNIMSNMYSPLYADSTMSLGGSRAFEFALDRTDVSLDMINEDYADSYDNVSGHAEGTYHKIRKSFTDILEVIHAKFHKRMFIRVRDVATAIKALSQMQETFGFFKAEYNTLEREAKARYVAEQTKLTPTKDTAEIEAEFDRMVTERLTAITEVFDGRNLKLINIDNAKTILGYIYSLRFQNADFHKNFAHNLEAFAEAQLASRVTHKQYKIATIDSRIRSTLNDNTIDVNEKHNQLSTLIYNKEYKLITTAEQEEIAYLVNLRNYITSTKAASERYYDTHEVAYLNKYPDAYETTLTGREVLQMEGELAAMKRSLSGTRGAITRARKLIDKDAQREKLVINTLDEEGNPVEVQLFENPTTDVEELVKRINETEALLDYQATMFTEEQILTSKTLKRQRINLMLELLQAYPEFQAMYVNRFTAKYNEAKTKALNAFDTATKKVQQTVRNAYDNIESINKEIELLKTNIQYRVFSLTMPLIRDEHMRVYGTRNITAGKSAEDIINQVYIVYEETLKELMGHKFDAQQFAYIILGKTDASREFLDKLTELQLKKEDIKKGLNKTQRKSLNEYTKQSKIRDAKLAVYDHYIQMYNDFGNVINSVESTASISETYVDAYNNLADSDILNASISNTKPFTDVYEHIESLPKLDTPDAEMESIEITLYAVFKDVIATFKRKTKAEKKQVLADIKAGLPVRKLTDQEIASYKQKYTSAQNKARAAMITQYNNYVKMYNTMPGVTKIVPKDTTKIKTHKLVELLEETVTKVSSTLDTLKANLIPVDTIPKHTTLPELTDQTDFKRALYLKMLFTAKQNYLRETVPGYNPSALITAHLETEFNKRFVDVEIDKIVNTFNSWIKNQKLYTPSVHNFGKYFDIDISALTTDAKAIGYAEILINNVRRVLYTTYNSRVQSHLKMVIKSLDLSKDLISSAENAERILKRLDNQTGSAEYRDILTKLYRNDLRQFESDVNKGKALSNVHLEALVNETMIQTKDHGAVIRAKRNVAKVKDQVEKLRSYRKSILSISSNVDKETKLIADIAAKEESIKASRDKYAELYKKENNVHGRSLSNSSLFRTYYKIPKDYTDAQVLDTVVDTVASKYDMTADEIRNYIKARGEYELHNSTVDSLITLLNFNHQNGGRRKPAAVIDMETYTYNGRVSPYQITLIVAEPNGRLTMNDIYINNALFHEYDVDDTGAKKYRPALMDFFKQQRNIYINRVYNSQLLDDADTSKTPRITYDDLSPIDKARVDSIVKAQTDELIERVVFVKNDRTFIETFMYITNATDIPIVAHNGKRFDFNIINDFAQYIGGNLLVNKYYQNFKSDMNVNEMYERIEKKDKTSDEVDAEYFKALQNKLIELHQTLEQQRDGELTITPQELLNIEKSMDSINERLQQYALKRAIKDASLQVDYIVDEDVKKSILDKNDGVVKTIVDHIRNYHMTPATADDSRQALIDAFMAGIDVTADITTIRHIVVDYVDRLLAKTKADYDQLVAGTLKINYGVRQSTGVTSTVRTNVNAYFNITKDNVDIDVSAQIRRIDILIENLQNLQKTVTNSSVVPTPAALLQQLAKDKTEQTKELTKMNAELKKLSDELDNYTDVDIAELFNKINEQARILQRKLDGFFPKIMTALNNIVIDNKRINDISSLLTLEDIRQRQLKQQLNDAFTALLTLTSRINEGASEAEIRRVLSTILDSSIMEYLKNPTEATRLRVLDDLNARRSALETNNTADAEALVRTTLSDMQARYTTQYGIIYESLVSQYNSVKDITVKMDNKSVKIGSLGELKLTGGRLDIQVLYKLYRALTADQAAYDKHTTLFRDVINSIKSLINLDKFLNTTYETITATQLKAIEADIAHNHAQISYTINFIENMTNKSVQNIEASYVGATYAHIMQTVGTMVDDLKELQSKSVLHTITGLTPTNEMTDEEYVDIASSVLDLNEVKAQSRNIAKVNPGVVYADPNAGNPIKVVRLNHNIITGRKFTKQDLVDTQVEGAEPEAQETYKFTSTDSHYHEVSQTLVHNPTTNTVTFKFKYAHLRKELQYSGGRNGYEIKELPAMRIDINSSADMARLKTFIEKFYYDRKTNNDVRTSVGAGFTEDSIVKHLEDGKLIDTSYASMKRLYQFFIDNLSAFRTNAKGMEALYNNDKKVKAYEKFGYNRDWLIIQDVSDIVEETFFNRIALMNATMRNQTNLKSLYIGIHNTITAKYKALETNSIVNQISADFGTDYNIDTASVDQAWLAQNNIELARSSEGSATRVLKYKPRFSPKFLYNLSTNPVRTMLTYKHLLAQYTTNGVLNDMYRTIPGKAPGKQLMNRFLNGHNGKQFMQDQEIYKTIKKSLIRNMNNGEVAEVFMPNVMSPELHQAYKNDAEYHQFGFNIPVGFVYDPRAFQDVVLIDYDYMMATQHGNGNKSWIGVQFGFKGAVHPVKDLYKTYGTYVVAHGASVIDRGTAGIYLDFVFNAIKSYLRDEVDGNGHRVIDGPQRALFDRIRPYLEKTYNDKIQSDGVLTLNDKRILNYVEELNSELVKAGIGSVDKEDYAYIELIQHTLTDEQKQYAKQIKIPAWMPDGTPITDDNLAGYDESQHASYKDVEIDASNLKIVKGHTYFFADNEHSAKTMETTTRMTNEGDVVQVIKDTNDSAGKGLSGSPTVFYALLQKVGTRIFEVFPPKHGDQDSLALLADVRAVGFKTYIDNLLGITDVNTVTQDEVDEYRRKLTELYNNKQIHLYVREQANAYLTNILSRNSDPSNTVYWDQAIAMLHTKATNTIANKMYDGTNSAYYRSTFRSHPGIREQYLGDTSLRMGEVVAGHESWNTAKALVKNSASKYFKNEALNKSPHHIDYIINRLSWVEEGYDVEHRKAFIIETLTSRGVLESNNKAVYAMIDDLAKDNMTHKDAFKQALNKAMATYMYLLAARSPVQDTGAVPVVKVIGYHNGYTMNANPYMYRMMGADNDGDTLGGALIEYRHVEPGGALNALDATRASYYHVDDDTNDDGTYRSYLDKSNDDQFSNTNATVKLTDGVYTYTVPSTQALSFRPTKNYPGKRTFLKGVRAYNNNEFTNIELFQLLNPETLNILRDKVTNNTNVLTDVEMQSKLSKTQHQKLMLFVNAYLHIMNKGSDVYTLPWYMDQAQIMKYYKDHRADIDALYSVELQLISDRKQKPQDKTFTFGELITIDPKLIENVLIHHFTPEEQAILQTPTHTRYNEVYEWAVYLALYESSMVNTVSRIGVSKNGVNYDGNKRKDVMISTHMPMYPNINNSKTSLFWRVIGAQTQLHGESVLTISSILKALFMNKDVSSVSDDALFKYINTHANALTTMKGARRLVQEATRAKRNNLNDPRIANYLKEVDGKSDFDLILNDIVSIINKYKLAEKELDDLYRTVTTSVSYKDVAKFLETSSKINIDSSGFVTGDPVLVRYYKAWQNMDTVVDASHQAELLMYWFNDVQVAKQFRDGKTKSAELAMGYINQHVIDRVALNNLSNSMSMIIAVAKHFGIDRDSNAYFLEHTKEIDKQTSAKAVRKIMIGHDLEHTIGVSINADRHTLSKLDGRIENGTYAKDINEAYYALNAPVNITKDFTNKVAVEKNLEDLIRENGKMILLGNMGVPNHVMNTLVGHMTVLNNALKFPNKILDNDIQAIEEAIIFFNEYNIPYYRLMRWVVDSLSTGVYLKSLYEANVSGDAFNMNSSKVVANSVNLYKFALMFKEPVFKEMFNKQTANNLIINNFFNNVNDLDDMYVDFDASGNRISFDASEFVDNESLVIKVGDNNQLQLSDNGDLMLRNKSERLIADEIDARINTELQSIEDMMAELKTELSAVVRGLELSDAKIKQATEYNGRRGETTKAMFLLKHQRMQALNRYNYIAEQISAITDLNNKHKQVSQQIKEQQEKIKQLKAEIEGIEDTIKFIDATSTYIANTGDLRTAIQAQIDEYTVSKQEAERRAWEYAFNNNVGGGILFLQNSKGSSIADATQRKPKYLVQKDLDTYRENSLLNMSSKVSLLINIIQKPTPQIMKSVYDYLKQNGLYYRLVEVVPPDDDEGLYKTILNKIRKYDPTVDDVPFADYNFLRDELNLKFKNMNELKEWQDAGGKVKFNGVVYDKIDPKVILEANKKLNYTYKELVIRSVDELTQIYNNAKQTGAIVGIISQDDWMQSLEQNYSSILPTTRLGKMWRKGLVFAKNMTKLTPEFLIRNLSDTVNQLITNEIVNFNGLSKRGHMQLTKSAIELYNDYKYLSDEHSITIANVLTHYQDILSLYDNNGKPTTKVETIQAKIDTITQVLKDYIALSDILPDSEAHRNVHRRIKRNADAAKRLIKSINAVDLITQQHSRETLLKHAVTFIGNMTFGEYAELYDNREVNGVWYAGVSMKARDNNNQIIKNSYLRNKYKTVTDYDWKMSMLRELSAFMNTSATQDYLRTGRKEMLPFISANYRTYDQRTAPVYTYEQLADMIKHAQKKSYRESDKDKYGIMEPLMRPFVLFRKGYDYVNEHIENGARIVNFFYNINIHNQTLDDAVLDSLSHWFNYGKRSNFEADMMIDMPFFSFPIRSIMNWNDRLLSPRYWRIMSQFVDGWYGQYLDEDDKEYDEYTKYQIANGWLPISDKFGIRIGNGAFDTMQILYGTGDTIAARRSPLLRGVNEFVQTLQEGEDPLLAATRGLASGAFGGSLIRGINALTGLTDAFSTVNSREMIGNNRMASEVLETRLPSPGTIWRGQLYDMGSDYSKYTPNRYRTHNARYARYENIYKDWFNKYGRMRKPRVDPYKLVKDIQWKTYVRHRQNKNR